MRINFFPNIFIYLIIFTILFSSCNSLKQPKQVFEVPDYTEKDIVENEKKQIEKLKTDFPVQAYWRAGLLGDEETLSIYEENLLSLLKKSSDENNYSDAWKYYLSLEASGSQQLKKSGIDQKLIYSGFVSGVPALFLSAENKALLPRNLSDCVNATVTIWVDKGIKIENGVGYADRVLGSGFFIDKSGYIVTNHHVISDLVNPKYEGYSRLFVKLARDQETRIPAKVIGYDETLDLALLKAEIDAPYVLELGSSSDLSIGDKVSAIGTPLGLHGTVTTGIVSAVDRKLFTTGSVMQIDAAVNSGNSGGPLIDSKMKVQAIVFAGILQYQGLNFAIPVEYLKQDLPFLYAGGKRKQVWCGCYGHTKKEGVDFKGLEVQYVMPGGSASRAGLKKGDVIVSACGIPVDSIETFQDILRDYTTESIVKIVYEREGEKVFSLLYLDERPENPGYEIYRSDLIQHSFIPIFGMELTPASTLYSKKFTISDIIKGSIADESGFSVLDPVAVSDVDFSEKKDMISAAIMTRNKKKGYFDVSMRIGNQLDSPYYF